MSVWGEHGAIATSSGMRAILACAPVRPAHARMHTSPPPRAASLPADLPLRQLAAEKLPAAAAAYGSLSFHEAAEAVLALASRSNQYLEETQPWTKLKKVRGAGVWGAGVWGAGVWGAGGGMGWGVCADSRKKPAT